MAKTDRDLTVINSMTEEQFKNQINSDGKAPALINQLVMTEDDDSFNAKQLVKDITFPAITSDDNYSCEITGLDLEGDGGYYDIIINFPTTSSTGNPYFRINNKSNSGGYVWGSISSDNLHSTSGIVQDTGLLGILTKDGPTTTIMKLWLVKGVPYFDITYQGYYKGPTWSKVFGYTNLGNVNSIQILCGQTVPEGTEVKIYKRLS